MRVEYNNESYDVPKHMVAVCKKQKADFCISALIDFFNVSSEIASNIYAKVLDGL